MHFKLLLALFLCSHSVQAQTAEPGFIKDLIESLAENLPEDYDLFELEDRLIYFSRHPINLNQTNLEELKSLVFLSPLQLSNFFVYFKTNGPFIDVLELQSIPNFDMETVERLLPFVTVTGNSLIMKPTLKNLRKFGENDLFIRTGRILELPISYAKSSGSKYLGTPERLLLRYKYNFAQRIDAGLVAEKDAGEKWNADFKSAHLAIFNTWKFDKIVLGDYSLQFGQGLTLWSGFAFGKAPDVTSVAKKDLGLRPYNSTNEYSFLRGLATTVAIGKHLDFTGFVSYRKLDASLSLNSNGQEVLTTINESGYHRTATEIKNRNSLAQLFFGGALQYQQNNLQIGLITHRTQFNRSFTTGNSPYRYDDFSGKTLTNLGLHYTYSIRNLYLFGEIAKSLNSGMAYLNGVLISLSAKASAVVLYRKYASNYHNFFNQATAEATSASNETGLYIGFNLYPSKSWAIAVYADYFKFPWLKFRIDAPSAGYELLGQLSYIPSKTLKVQLRYKSELKQQNTDLPVPINYLEDVKKESYRADVNWKLNKALGFQNRLEVSQYQKGTGHAEFGYLAYQDVSYKATRGRLSGNIRVAYFNIPYFNSRIYAYEDDVLYSFSFGLYNGKGLRNYLNLKYKLLKRLDLWGRYAISLYSKASTVGSGLDEIDGNKKSDVKLQLRYQF